jgi:hypothetical protein
MFWTTVGYSAGLASSVYLQRRVRRAVQRVTPVEVREAVGARGSDLVDRARRFGGTVRAAAQEGRTAMRETERELREEHAPKGGWDAPGTLHGQ